MSGILRVPVAGLAAAVGSEFGPTPPVRLDQERISAFGDLTQDRQWIHVDPARAAAGPFGTTIAHGFLTLSLLGGWLVDCLQIDGAAEVLNYGLDRVRFLAPVPSGSQVCADFRLAEVQDRSSGTLLRVAATVRIVGGDPVCSADPLILVRRGGPS